MSRQGEGAPAQPGRPWRRVVAVAVTLGVLAAVFAGVFPRFAHYSQAWSSIQRIPAAFVIALVAAAVVNIAVSAWPLQAALPGLGYRPAFVVGQTSYAMSNALPGGGAVALGVKYDMLGSYGFGTAAAAGATAISAVFNILATLAMPVLSVLALLLYGQLHWQYLLIAIVGSAVVGLSGAAMAAVLRSEDGARRVGRRLDRYLNPLVRRLRRGRGVDVSGKVLDFRSHVVGVMRARWPAVVGSTLLPLFTSWSVLLFGLRGLEHAGPGHSGVTWAESLAAFSAAMVVLFLPVSVGGLGTADAALTGLLAAFGATGSQALAVDVVWRAATFVPQVLTGVVTFLSWRVTRRRRADPPARS